MTENFGCWLQANPYHGLLFTVGCSFECVKVSGSKTVFQRVCNGGNGDLRSPWLSIVSFTYCVTVTVFYLRCDDTSLHVCLVIGFETIFPYLHCLQLALCHKNWETDFHTPQVLGGAALFDNSAPAV